MSRSLFHKAIQGPNSLHLYCCCKNLHILLLICMVEVWWFPCLCFRSWEGEQCQSPRREVFFFLKLEMPGKLLVFFSPHFSLFKPGCIVWSNYRINGEKITMHLRMDKHFLRDASLLLQHVSMYYFPISNLFHPT